VKIPISPLGKNIRLMVKERESMVLAIGFLRAKKVKSVRKTYRNIDL